MNWEQRMLLAVFMGTLGGALFVGVVESLEALPLDKESILWVFLPLGLMLYVVWGSVLLYRLRENRDV